ncbi:hypothetical protein GCM10017786_09090 [Amycolatopsis deserti]|uniref:Uncharacterized protein n=1 Tax=Amycolatopsis deserti TaxID=185696 RepID=A0ABQ3II81_9PSEU|nr:hypothetical protein GCM10017786_09090 [Amycolatopsis deserti]
MSVEGPGGDQYDGLAYYRVDANGERLIVLPATCRAGRHSLAASGYRAVVGSAEIAVECQACRAEGASPAAWRLGTSGSVAARAELDDQPYLGRRRWSEAAPTGRK